MKAKQSKSAAKKEMLRFIYRRGHRRKRSLDNLLDIVVVVVVVVISELVIVSFAVTLVGTEAVDAAKNKNKSAFE